MGSSDTVKPSVKSMIICHVLAVLVVAAWGSSFISTKILLNAGLGSTEIYLIRFLLAYVIMVILAHKRWFCRRLSEELLFLLCGLFAGSLYFLVENTALEYTTTTNVGLLTSTSPLFTMLFISLVYRSERPNGGMVIGSLVAFAGVVLVILNSATDSDGMGFNPIGDILSLIAAASWAVYSLILRRLNVEYDVMFITRKTFFYGMLTSLPVLLLETPKPGREPFLEILSHSEVWGNLIFLGLGSSLLAFLIWAEVIKRVGAVKANNYLYLQPIVTMIVSYLILKEAITLVGICGSVLILGGLWLGDRLSQTWRKQRQSR